MRRLLAVLVSLVAPKFQTWTAFFLEDVGMCGRWLRMLISFTVCLMAAVILPAEARSEGFLSVDAKVMVDAGSKHVEQSSTAVPFSLHTSAADEQSVLIPGPGGTGHAWCNGSASAVVEAIQVRLSLQAVGAASAGRNARVSLAADALAAFTSTVSGPVFETRGRSGFEITDQHRILDEFFEGQVTGTGSGIISTFYKGYSVHGFGFTNLGGIPNIRSEALEVVWSVGAPAGSSSTPFGSSSTGQSTQVFSEPTPGDAAKDGGLRYQAPNVDSAIALGFDLSGADQNPFTSFRFPEVPIGANNHFTLKLGDTEIAGLAGETVNLRRFAPDGFAALSLRGDLSPFLNSPEPPLTFGLAFAQPGIGSFTLKPVPEPATATLAALGFALVLLGRHRVFGRLMQ